MTCYSGLVFPGCHLAPNQALPPLPHPPASPHFAGALQAVGPNGSPTEMEETQPTPCVPDGETGAWGGQVGGAGEEPGAAARRQLKHIDLLGLTFPICERGEDAP